MPGGEELELVMNPEYVAGDAHANSDEEEESSDNYGDAQDEFTFDSPLLRRDVERSLLGYRNRRSSTRRPNVPPRDTIVPPAVGSPLPLVRDPAVMPTRPVVLINPVRGFGRPVVVVEEHAAHRGSDQSGPIVLRHKEPIVCQDGVQNTAKVVRSSSIDHWSSPRLPHWARHRTPRSRDSDDLEEGDKDEGRGDGEDEISAG